MRVALKYCGGCDPSYDRVEYWEAVDRAAAGSIEWVRLEEGDFEAVLLICGCQTACPDEELNIEGRVVVLRNDITPPEDVAAELLDKEL